MLRAGRMCWPGTCSRRQRGGDRRQGDVGHGQGEGVADAFAGAGAEGDEGVAGWLGALGVPAIGVERFGVVVEAGAVLYGVGDAGAGRQQVSAQAGVGGDRAGGKPVR
jgi:hypothetical protein